MILETSGNEKSMFGTKEKKKQLCAVGCCIRDKMGTKEGLRLMVAEGHFSVVQSVYRYSELRPASYVQLISYSLETRT